MDPDSIDIAVFAKTHLGMIITLYDDLADHPEHRNPELLSELYHLNVGQDRTTPFHIRGHNREIFELARFMFSQLTTILSDSPGYEMLVRALRFDIEMFYSCNRHSELISSNPDLGNLLESQLLGPYNMGMVAAGMMDLMNSQNLVQKELGRCREVFLLGQRLGRISNLIFTLKRERSEGDQTNEILIAESTEKELNYRSVLLQEFSEKQYQIRSCELKTFKSYQYATGLLDLHNLHSSLEGKI